MFIDLTFFGRTAEIANQYLRKGSKVLVDGRLTFEQWTAQDGTKRSRHSITVENLKMLDSKADSMNPNYNSGYDNQASQNNYGGGQPQQQQSYSQPQQSSYAQPQASQQPSYNAPQPQMQQQPPVPEIDIDDDEIPF